jgi:hypothetical protein
MSTSMNIHADRGDKIEVEVKDWGSYLAVTIKFGSNSITMYPKETADVPVSEQLHEVLQAFSRPTIVFPDNKN